MGRESKIWSFDSTGVFPATKIAEPDEIPFLKTDIGSLIFTIAANGHIWGHRLGEDSKRSDIELEIFAPCPGGCTLRRKNETGRSAVTTPMDHDLTEGQSKAIHKILAQKQKLGALLGCIPLPEVWVLDVKQNYEKLREPDKLLRLNESDFDGKVTDCSFREEGRGLGTSKLDLFNIEYLDDKYTFELSGGSISNSIRLGKSRKESMSGFGDATVDGAMDMCRKGYRLFTASNTDFPHCVFSTAQAKDKKFFVGDFPACAERNLIPDELKFLADTINVFWAFAIDDALLLLEEKRLSETESELYWTVALAQNKVLKEHRRIRSNNIKA